MSKNLVFDRSGFGNFQTDWRTFGEVRSLGLGRSETGDFYQTMATVLLAKSERAVYKSCPNTDCKKKIIDLENGMYRCEKCKREYPNFSYRYLLSVIHQLFFFKCCNAVSLDKYWRPY